MIHRKMQCACQVRQTQTTRQVGEIKEKGPMIELPLTWAVFNFGRKCPKQGNAVLA